tara:strand:- start:12925 stop:13308 length:384 start_codon:yes stop_codon:yes gene_type:complete
MADRIIKILENGRTITRGIGKKTAGSVIELDNEETLPVSIDWSDWLDGDTISSVTNDPTGVTVSGESNTTTTAAFSLSGNAGLVEHRITTAAGTIKEHRLYVDAVGYPLSNDYGYGGGCYNHWGRGW